MWRFMARVGTGKIFLKEVFYRPVRQKCRFLYTFPQTREKLVMDLLFCNLFTHKALGILKNLFKSVRVFQIELECGSVVFLWSGKTGIPREKPFRAKEGMNN